MNLMRWQPRRSLIRNWDPFAELTGLRRLFDQPVESLLSMQMLDGERVWQPSVDVTETKEDFVVKADVPGMKAEDIQINIEADTLTLKGERELEEKVEEEGYFRIERRYGAFERTVMLPPTVNAEAVKASYTNGVLEIRLPKREEAKPKRITVKAA